ncbi:NAD(P)-binding protein [Hortaea werneckii]|nr:NAD(P)-binding protein [Hortaea werneckii]
MASHPEYANGTNGSDVANAFAENIRDKTIVITGVSPRSLGETLALILAKHSPKSLILASRTQSKLESVADAIRQQSSDKVEVHPVVLDLSDQKAIHDAAKQILQLTPHIDILINNAGFVSSSREETVEGIEKTFGTNHVGHWLFTSLLAPRLVAAAQGTSPGATRVVNVSSMGHKFSPVRFSDYNFVGGDVPADEEPPSYVPSHMRPDKAVGRHYQGFTAYAQSKTANILHCYSLNRRLPGVKAFAAHPGTIATDLSRNLSSEDAKVIESATDWINQDQGTATILVGALDPKLSMVGDDHAYLSDCQVAEPAKHARSPDVAERLWTLSEQLTKTSRL